MTTDGTAWFYKWGEKLFTSPSISSKTIGKLDCCKYNHTGVSTFPGL